MSYYLIHKALTQSYIDLALGVSTAYENSNFNPEGLDQFIDISFLPASTDVISKDTLDEEIGIYQISIYTRSGISLKTSYELADTIASYYSHGLKLTSGAQKVFIDRTSRSSGRNSDGWFIVDLSINYIADLTR